MPDNLLTACRNFLATAYRQALGYPLDDFVDSIDSSKLPVWKYVDQADFVSANESTSPTVGLVLDPEIGVLLYLIEFQKLDDIRSQVRLALSLRSKLLREGKG